MANGIGCMGQHHHQPQQHDHLFVGNFGILPYHGFKPGILLDVMAASATRGDMRALHLKGIRDGGGREGLDYVSEFRIQDVQAEVALGAGGAGTILKCRHTSLGHVAVKVPQKNNQTAIVFQRREALVLAGLSASVHDGKDCVIQALNIADSYPSCPIVMPLASGDLWQTNRDGFGIKQLLGIAEGMLRGLKFLHNNAIIHCDFKLGNILLFLGGDGVYYAKVADLGLATVTDATCAQLTGTVGNIAPENYFGANKASPERDVFAAGVAMANLLFPGLPRYSGENIFVSDNTVSPGEKHILKALWKNSDRTLANELEYEVQKLVTGRVMMERGLDNHLRSRNLHAFVPPRCREMICKHIRSATHPEQLARPSVDTLMAAVEMAKKNIPAALPAPTPRCNPLTAAAAAVATPHAGTAALGLPQWTPSNAAVGAFKSFSVHRNADGRRPVPKAAGSSSAAAAVSPARSAHKSPATHVAAGNARVASRRTSLPPARMGNTREIAKKRSAQIGVDVRRLASVPEGLPAAVASRVSPAHSAGTLKPVSMMEAADLAGGVGPSLPPSLADASRPVSSGPSPSLRENTKPAEPEHDAPTTISGDNANAQPRTTRPMESLNSCSRSSALSSTAEVWAGEGWGSGQQPLNEVPRPESEGGWGVWGQVPRGPPRPESEGGWGNASCNGYYRPSAGVPVASRTGIRRSGVGCTAQRPGGVVARGATPCGPRPARPWTPRFGLATRRPVYRQTNERWTAASGTIAWVAAAAVATAAADCRRIPDSGRHGIMAARDDWGGTAWKDFPTPVPRRTARRVDTGHVNRHPANGMARVSRSSARIEGWEEHNRCMVEGQWARPCAA